MKTKLKRISKSALSVILALMMVVSTMVVGIVTVGATSITSDGNAILYFNMKAVNYWDTTKDNGGNFIYFFNSSQNNAWSAKAERYQTVSDNEDIFYVKVPNGTWDHCILTRNSVTSDPNFTGNNQGGNLWNKTKDLELDSNKNYIKTFTDYDTSVTWSTIKPASNFTLSADNKTVDAGTTVNFSTTIDSNSTYNDITSNSLSVTGGSSSDYSINGNSITFNNAGTYTVKNTVTYNPKGYTGITSSVDTNTVTVTVNGSTDLTYTLNDSKGNTSDFTKTSDGVYETTVTLNADTDYKYYIKDSKDTYYRNGSGTISTSGGSVKLYKYGDDVTAHVITVKATNAGEYTFKWEYTSGDNSGTLSVTYPTISNYTVSVEARYKSYNNESQGYNDVPSTLPDDIGATYTVNGNSNATVTPGDSVTLSASTTNNDKYTFAGWYTDADCNTSVGTTTPTPTANTTYYALYQQKYKNVTYNVTGADGTINGFTNGTVKKTGVGTEVTVTASDVTGYTPNITVSGATLSSNKFTVGTSDVTVTATYTVNPHTVTFASLTNGTFDSSTSKSVNYGETVTVVVTPNAGYNVDSVTYGSESATVTHIGDVATATFSMPDSDVEVNATFSKKEYTISSTVNESSMGRMEILVNNNAKTNFNIGDAIKITPNPNEGYECTSYTVTLGDGTSTNITNGSAYSVTIDAAKIGNITVTATFAAKSYNVTYAGDNCTKPANTTKAYNSSVKISGFTASSGYKITGYTVTKTDDSSTTVNVTDDSFTMPAYDVTVTAIVKKQHTVTVTSGENGSVSPTTATVTDVETVELTATPADGYIVDTWSLPTDATLLSGTLKGDKITVSVTADVTINVTFKKSENIVIYLAYESDKKWDGWSFMSVKDNDDNIYHGTYIGAFTIHSKKCQVSYLTLPGDAKNWTSFKIGNETTYFRNKAISGAPEYGFCYLTVSGDDNATTFSCAATTISSPKANNSETASCFVNETVNLTSTVTKANTATGNVTAGGTDYTVSYLVTDSKNNTTEVSSSWTPTSAGTYTVTAKLTDGYTTFTSAKTATVTVKSKTQSAVTASALNASVKITDNSGTEITQAYEGDTVNVTVTPKVGYKCTGLTVKKATDVDVTVTKNSDGTYSFTMPGEDVTVTPTIVLSGGSEGTLSDRYFFISTSEGYAWSSSSMPKSYQAYNDGTYYYVTLTADQIKTITNNNVKANLYFALSSSQSLDNLYHLNESYSDNKWDAINETTESCNIEKKYNNNTNIGKVVSYVLLQIKDEKVTSVTLKYKYNNASDYIVSAETSTIKNDTVEVIAKDATLRAEGDYKSTLHEYGDTYFYTEDSEGNKKYYTSGTTTIPNKMSFTRESQKSVATVSLDEVKKGTTLHIETQDVKTGYYVAGYVVNGETLALFNQDETPVLDYTIPYDTEANTKIEITPVYFAKDSSNCVTFYVEGFDSTVQGTWGNTIACYPYYSGAKSQDNAFSSYPGQPMLYKDGKYFIQVPRSFNSNKVVGMTLNNYYWDDVHKDIYSSSLTNTQTYDFDDFVRIADKQVDGTYIADNIIFSFKFREGYNNFGYQIDDSKVSPSTISYDTFDAGNGWENLTDHNGNLVNIFGTQLFKTTDAQYSEKSTIENNPTNNEHLLIVSNGYDENYQGYYATEWTIYAYKDSAYKKVAQIPSSALVLSYEEVANSTEVSKVDDHEYLSQLKSYATAYAALNTDEYKNLPAYITYEENDQQSQSNDASGTNLGYRCDGRWYYSKINDEIISNVKIQYADSLTGTFTDDPFITDTNQGETTNAKAYFTNSTAYGNTTCEGKIGKGNFDITTTYSGSTYMFVGWYLEKEGVYTRLTNSTNASIEMTGSETYVARYVKVPAGSINISHSLFSNVSETAKKGAGTLGLQVTLSYNDGTNEFNQPYTYNTSDSSVSTNVLLSDVQKFYTNVSNSVGASSLNSECFSIKVSLTSTPADKTSLINAYVEDYANTSESYLSFSTASSTISGNLNWTAPSVGESMEISIPFNKIFTGTNNTSITDKVEFFSEFETNPISYEITYNFETRLYGEKQYKQSGNVSVGTDGLISANGTYSFTNAYIMRVAPDESNFMKTFNWDDASITQSYDSTSHKLTVTVNSTQIDRTVHATINLPDAEAKHISTAYGGHFKENGEFVMAPAKNASNEVFSYWRINAVNDDGTEGDFVANCYSQYFNYVGYDDYIVTAVYGQGKNTEIYDDTKTSTTVTFLEYSRNHWNDYDSVNNPHPGGAPYGGEGTEYDRLYADFALAFNYNGFLLNETDLSELKLGYVLDVTGNSTVDNLNTNILANSNKSSFKIDGNNVLNYSIDRTDLDNKNRVECYYGIKNTDTNRNYNIKVYSYMIVDGKVTLSEPITICYNGAINK